MTINGVVYLVADNGNVYSNDDINDYIGRYDKSKTQLIARFQKFKIT